MLARAALAKIQLGDLNAGQVQWLVPLATRKPKEKGHQYILGAFVAAPHRHDPPAGGRRRCAPMSGGHRSTCFGPRQRRHLVLALHTTGLATRP